MTAVAPLRRVEQCMGTVFSIDVRDPVVDPAEIEDVVRWLHWVDATFSTYQPGSQVSRLGRGELTVADCAPEVGEILDRCERLGRDTGGYFSAYPLGVLDPSGVVKGWAIEQASDRLRRAGSTSHCVNGGGDVQCAGDAEPGQPWRVGIAHPLRPGDLAAVVTGTDVAVATSGTAERGAHVIDPHTSRPAQALASLTLVGRHLTDVDAYATAAFAMGPAARDWVEQMPGIEGFAVALDGTTWRTDGLQVGT
ncbi:MAG: thiamine biosynthesis protein [Pseudonocardiales bacterium]|nr:thiamine biosynthesis protein [Pseudonocardiales bacterium]